MSDHSGPEATVPVVRAGRVEIVDDAGIVRAVLGAVEAPGGPSSFGVALLDAAGRARAWLALPPAGPELAFAREGNVVIHLGVSDDSVETVDIGAYVHLSAPDGGQLIGVHVADDISVSVRGGHADP